MQFKLRITYSINGKLAMLSHLELARTLERIVRRSSLPFAVTEGFSPHMKIAFGSALPVGVGGLREIFDITLKDYVSPNSALEALRSSSMRDLEIVDCHYVEGSAKAASVAFPVGTYEASLSKPLDDLKVPDAIEVIKKGKSKQLIVSDYLRGDVISEGNAVIFKLEQLPTGSLRPDRFIEALIFNNSSAAGQRDDEASNEGIRVLSITRIAQSKTDDDVR